MSESAVFDMEPKVSYIVTVYNKEAFLAQCLDSLLAQEGSIPYEVICVDNNSKDGSRAILEGYAARDSRIRVFDEPKQGVSCARNRGIDVARGEWLSFVDADDFVSPNMLETIVALSLDGSDVAIYAYDSYYTEEDRFQNPHTKYPEGVYSPVELCPCLLTMTTPSVCTKLFRRVHVESTGARFNDALDQGEDLDFTSRLLMSAQSIAFSNIPLYHYRRNVADSLSDQRARSAMAVHTFEVLEGLIAFRAQRGLPDILDSAVINQCVDELRYALRLSGREQYEDIAEIFLRDWQPRLEALAADESLIANERFYSVYAGVRSLEDLMFNEIVFFRKRHESDAAVIRARDAELKELRAQNGKLKKEIKNLQGGRVYRTGTFICAPFIKLRGLFKGRK